MAPVAATPSQSPDHRSIARQFIRTEPVALVLVLVLAIALFAITAGRLAHRNRAATVPPTTAMTPGR